MKMDFGGVEENIVTRQEFTLEDALKVLGHTPIAILGYGPQGQGQGLNLRDNGFDVVLGLRERYSKDGGAPTSWEKALEDGWKAGENLFSIENAAASSVIIAYLLSDAAQVENWHKVKPMLTRGKALYVSHGMPIHFHQATGIVPPDDVDVIMVAPKGPGGRVRANYLAKSGINSSYSVEQDASGRAFDRVRAMGMGIGSGYLFETTARKEVTSDHFGERAILLGEIGALAEASYHALRAYGATPEEAFIGSSEQLTQVILPIIGEHGVNGVYEQAREAGELGTIIAYQNAAREAAKVVGERLYRLVVDGVEAETALRRNSSSNYRDQLELELRELDTSEVWAVGKQVRDFGGDRIYGGRITNFALAGAVIGAMEAQFEKLITEGHSPSEAFNETVEELTQSLNLRYQKDGIAGLIGQCSTTAKRGSLDWLPIFLRAHLPVFMGNDEYHENTSKFSPAHNFSAISGPNMWYVGETVRQLRPENVR